MLQRYFEFSEDPFGSTPDPRCLYPSQTHQKALASLKHGFFGNCGFTTLITPPGMEKTTLLFHLLKHVQRIEAMNPNLTNPDFILPGQKILLPGLVATPVSENAMHPANIRDIL